MIRYETGDMLQSGAEAMVNTVNTVGVMGKGIALQFREAFPYNYKVYRDACKKKELQPGKMLGVWDENLLLGRHFIINFPTKVHWRQASRYEYIQSGLLALKELLAKEQLSSVAIPPLGCGNGGLDWARVKPMIEAILGDLDMEIILYGPNPDIKRVLQQQPVKKKVHLTPARAALLYALFAFESLGEYSSLFSANKLAYFLQRAGQALNLKFVPHHYGPYAIGVEKVLYHLNGTYLRGLEQGQARPFEPLHLNYEKWAEVKRYVVEQLSEEEERRLQEVILLIAGFSSELSLEILATVDFILAGNPSFSADEVMTCIESWNMRKKELFKREYVQRAYDHLQENFQSFPHA